jgi:hypothetical protein
MEAQLSRGPRRLIVASAFVFALVAAQGATGAGYRTVNFTVDAPTPQLAKEIGDAAEHWRRELSNDWLGRELPAWSKPCPIKAVVHPTLGAGGATSFVFDRGEVFGWRMDIQGSRERVLDSVLPHEITHTIFATHFRQPLPRWADEGACTTVEHKSEIDKQERLLITFLKTKKGIPFSDMFAMKEYPSEVLPLYAQGHSLTTFLIAQRGKRAFLEFLADGMQDENWPRAIAKHYEYEHLLALQNSWLEWVRSGRPTIEPVGGRAILASAEVPTPAASDATASVAAARATLGRGGDAGTAPATQAAAAAKQRVVPTPVGDDEAAPTSAGWTPASTTERAVQPGRSVYESAARGDLVRR